MKKIVCFLIAVIIADTINAEILYDVDFSSPTHTLGEPPSLGGTSYPRNTPTSFDHSWGTAEVIQAYGDLTDQPLLLIPEIPSFGIPGAGLRFDLEGKRTFPVYTFEMDMFLSSFEHEQHYNGDGFGLYFYTNGSTAHSIHFRDDGSIHESSNHLLVTVFPFDEAFRFGVTINLPENEWTVYMNEEQVYTNTFHVPYPASPEIPTELWSIGMNLRDDGDTPSVPVGVIDNIGIVGLPEPATLSMVSLGLLLLRKRGVL